MTDEDGFTFYVITNYRGDVVRITDTSGQEVASYSYDPWGKVLSASESASLTNQPLRYASYVYDTETSLYYLQRGITIRILQGSSPVILTAEIKTIL